MHPSYVDIENELLEIQAEVNHLSSYLNHIDHQNLPTDDQERWKSALICASATEKIYTGCERVMARLAAEIDKSHVMHVDGWHISLLRRMANPYPGVRGVIISNVCYLALDKLRSFRHRERNTYGINLDYEIVVERASESVITFANFRNEIKTFFSAFDTSI